MNGKVIRERLRGGRRVYGTLVVSTSPHWPTAVKAAGADFVFIDTEHIAIDRGIVAWMCQTYQAMDIAPLVRVHAPDPYLACVALDNGAVGVIAPYVESPEQALQLRGAVKLRPLKGQVLDGVLRGRKQLTGEIESYIRERNAGSVLVLNIESVPAIEALDGILSAGDPDAVLVGPHDLSCSLGVPEQYGSTVFLDAVGQIISRCSARGVGVGIAFLGRDRTGAGVGRDGRQPDRTLGRHQSLLEAASRRPRPLPPDFGWCACSGRGRARGGLRTS